MAKLNTLQTKLSTSTQHQPKKNWGKGRGGRPWRRLKQLVHERDNWTCQQPNCGIITTELICDHIKASAFGGTDDISNLQSLCKTCSDDKTHQESMGGGYSKL